MNLRTLEVEPLVIDVHPNRLGVGGVDHGLAVLGKAVRIFGVLDDPRLMQSVDEGAMARKRPALFVVAANAEVAVTEREDRLVKASMLGVDATHRETPGVVAVVTHRFAGEWFVWA